MTSPIILLHGALGSKDQYHDYLKIIGKEYEVYAFDFAGHGKQVDQPESLSIELLSNQLLGFINDNGLMKPLVFGYSMGGYVALYAELISPGTLGGVICLGTKFKWDPASATGERAKLNAETIRTKAPGFMDNLVKLHGENWESLLEKTGSLMEKLGNRPKLTNAGLGQLDLPVHIYLGELDKMVTVGESEAAARALPKSAFTVIPGLKHPLEQLNAMVLLKIINNFIAENQ